MARPQRTIRDPVELEAGQGLFSGREVHVRLQPADASTGYLFVRTDLPDRPVVPATVEALSDGMRCTVLRWNNVEVRAVEHILSACSGLRVDNLIIEEIKINGRNGSARVQVSNGSHNFAGLRHAGEAD